MSLRETSSFCRDGQVYLPVAVPARPPTPPDALLRRLAAGLAHNVNNALTGVISCLELVLRDAAPGTPQHARLSDGLASALRLAERTRRLVAFARRPEPGRADDVCLRRAAEDAARRAAASRPDLTVTVQVGAGPWTVRVNEPLLLLVLEQVIANAAEAMPDGGALTLRVWDEGPRRCLSVADSGPGLSPEVRRRVFEPFFTTKSFGHLGVGLALCRDAMEAMGGAIHLTGGEGQGTTATLSFPPPGSPNIPHR